MDVFENGRESVGDCDGWSPAVVTRAANRQKSGQDAVVDLMKTDRGVTDRRTIENRIVLRIIFRRSIGKCEEKVLTGFLLFARQLCASSSIPTPPPRRILHIIFPDIKIDAQWTTKDFEKIRIS